MADTPQLGSGTGRNALQRAWDRVRPPAVTDMNRRSVGIVSIAVILAACVAAFSIGSLDLLQDRYPVSAVFPDAANLRNGSQVRVAGVEVGEVTGLEADRERGQVVVTFEVSSDIHLGQDTTAEVALNTLLGGEYIRLEGVTDDGPFLADLPREERRIPISRTEVPFSVNEAFNEATEVVGAIDTQTVNDLVAEFADIATDSGPQLERVLSGLEAVARAFNDREAVIRDLLDQTEVLTSAFRDKDDVIVELIESGEVVLQQISDRREELATVLGDGSDVVQTLATIISTRRAELDQILADLDLGTDLLAERQNEVNTILAWSGPTYQQVSRIASHGPWIDALPISLGPDLIAVLNSLYPQLNLDGGP